MKKFIRLKKKAEKILDNPNLTQDEFDKIYEEINSKISVEDSWLFMLRYKMSLIPNLDKFHKAYEAKAWERYNEETRKLLNEFKK